MASCISNESEVNQGNKVAEMNPVFDLLITSNDFNDFNDLQNENVLTMASTTGCPLSNRTINGIVLSDDDIYKLSLQKKS